ncbi:hypothetical protein AB205_0048110 [Aquarana catesbeiana]|uniref:Alpha-2-macroglobulin bait region domain-containing protein n=1 Tax=Aquarana catesbeiana TaxID=8400 RepID=A0A2G9SHS7_AQUCT|nr:hypothetical protein AB205_0048110 [Aquarana catesbeiana]
MARLFDQTGPTEQIRRTIRPCVSFIGLAVDLFGQKYKRTLDLNHVSNLSDGLESGSEMLEAELENIHIVKSRYKIFFTKTSKYFKPGMPFDLTVFVTNPDGSPANRIKVVAQPGKVEGLTGPEGTARLTLNTAANINHLQITVKTSWGLSAEREASATMTAVAYNSNGNYLHIGITTAEVKPGDNLNVAFNIRSTNAAVQNQITHFTYVIMNKGRVLKVDRQQWLAGQALVTMNIPITVDYIPSFRLIAYYIVGNDIVSDSIWVNVAVTCMGMVSTITFLKLNYYALF